MLMTLGATTTWLLLPELLGTDEPPVVNQTAQQEQATKPQAKENVSENKDTQPEKVEAEKPVETIKLMLVSIPTGASVYLGSQRLGRTPLTIERPQGDDAIVLSFRKRDHRSRRVTTKLAKSRTIKVELEPEFELIR